METWIDRIAEKHRKESKQVLKDQERHQAVVHRQCKSGLEELRQLEEEGEAIDRELQDAGGPAADPSDPDSDNGPGQAAGLGSSSGKPGSRQKGRGGAREQAGALMPERARLKGQKPSKEARKLAAEAERQRRAELELLLLDDTSLRDATAAGEPRLQLSGIPLILPLCDICCGILP